MDVAASGLGAMVEGLIKNNDYDTALAAIGIFLGDAPEDPALLNLWGSTAYEGKRYGQALEALMRLEKLGPLAPPMRVFKAECLNFLGRTQEAAALMRELYKEQPGNADYAVLLAQFARTLGHFDESEKLLERVPATMPGYAALRGWHDMRHGKFLEGFSLLERELGIYRAGAVYNLPAHKELQGGAAIAGKKILYALEGGFGDEVAYARFAPQLEAAGAQVVVGASPRMAPVVARMSGIKEAVSLKTIDHASYDFWVPAMKAIAGLQISDPSEGVAFPYLAALPEEIAKWRPVLEKEAGGRKKIGIHWQGNWEFDYLERKSPPAALMLRLAQAGKLFSLQRDAGGNAMPANDVVFETEGGPPSWESTIAVISEMDYIVTNDTSAAHLAGAMGKKTLVLLPHAPHHYFLPFAETWGWYPGARQFRQPSWGDWEAAVDAAVACIQNDPTSV